VDPPSATLLVPRVFGVAVSGEMNTEDGDFFVA